MKTACRIGVLALLGLLASCATNKDNSEPPALLTDIEKQLDLVQNWQLDTRAATNRAAYRLRPLLAGERVYSIDIEGSIVSVDLPRGRRLWRFETGLAAATGLGGDSGNLIATSQDGEIASYEVIKGGLRLRWQTRIAGEIRATPVLDGNQLFVRSVDGKLRSLDAATGEQQWLVTRRVPALSLTGNSEPMVDGQLVYTGFDDGKLIAFERDSGQVRWEATISLPRGRTEVERLVDLDGGFALRDGVIYIASFQGRLAAVQAVSGDLLWSRQFSSYQSIAIDDDALYLSAENSDIWSIDRRTGSAFWKQDVLHARKITAPSIIGTRLVVADLDGYLHWFNRQDGKLVGRIRTSELRNFVRPLIWKKSVLTLDRSGFLTSVSIRR